MNATTMNKSLNHELYSQVKSDVISFFFKAIKNFPDWIVIKL